MKYKLADLMPKRYPENRPNEAARSHEAYWTMHEYKGVRKYTYWFKKDFYISKYAKPVSGFVNVDSGVLWFIDISGAPEEVRPRKYPDEKPEKEGRYICHFKPYIANGVSTNEDHWGENYWIVDDIEGNSDWKNAWNLVDYFINYPLEEEMEENNIFNSLELKAKLVDGGDLLISVDRGENYRGEILINAEYGFTNLAKKWLDLQDYNITKRAPEIAPCPNPECGEGCKVNAFKIPECANSYEVHCLKCHYSGPRSYKSTEDAIRLHNLIAGKDK